MKIPYYIGSYAGASEDSIYRYELDTEKEVFLRSWAYAGAENPSYVLPHPDGKILYSVEELSPEGHVCAFEILPDGLRKVQSVPSGGADPCHLSLDDQARFLFVSNYSSGSLAVFRLDENGMIVEMTDRKDHTGRSVYEIRQASAHVHFSKYSSNGILYSCDLGEDRVYAYRLDREKGILTQSGTQICVPEGFGPRHLVVDEEMKRLCVLTEMGAALIVCEEDGRIVQTLSALPEGTDIESLESGAFRAVGAAIRMTEDGKYLMTSLRGHNSIAIFEKREDGSWKHCGVYPSGGRTPRDFFVLGDYVVAANQDSDRVSLLRFDREKRTLCDTGTMEIVRIPVCIMPAL